ncbi:MAG: hypothetical protein HZB33_13765 [Nitrospirae bacterium]|nr:hypothetical protein [Nitrospirota bacterium]
MMRTKTGGSLISMTYKPLCVFLLLAGLFFQIWLRSGVVSLTYNLRSLEERTMEARKETKLLLAERAKLMSLAKVTSSLKDTVSGESRFGDSGYVTPDRTKVVLVKKKSPEPYRASLEIQGKN